MKFYMYHYAKWLINMILSYSKFLTTYYRQIYSDCQNCLNVCINVTFSLISFNDLDWLAYPFSCKMGKYAHFELLNFPAQKCQFPRVRVKCFFHLKGISPFPENFLQFSSQKLPKPIWRFLKNLNCRPAFWHFLG